MTTFGRHILMLTASVLSAFGLAACHGADEKDIRYTCFETVSDKGWKSSDVLIFDPWPIDSIINSNATYRLEMMIRMKGKDINPDFRIVAVSEDEEGILGSDTLHINRNSGRCEFKHRYGTTEVSLTLAESLRLKEGYRVELHPLGDASATRGIIDIGLVLIQKTK